MEHIWRKFSFVILEILQVWNIRCAVVISLFFQILLIFLAPLRKRHSSYLASTIIWSAYLLADWTAIYAIGSIVNSGRIICPNIELVSNPSDASAALWAPFMLLHLGGPDSITAFSLEDNELWLRHLVRMLAQLSAVCYVYYVARPMATPFWLVILLVCLAGTIKYGERTRSLYLASLGTLKDSIRPEPDSGPINTRLMVMEESRLPAVIVKVNESEGNAENVTVPRQPLQVIQEGYRLYKIFRGLIVDHMFSFHERNESRVFFFGLRPDEAFKIMEVELNFMYSELFTKMATLHRNYYGYLFRFTCTALIVAALPILLFGTPHEKLPSNEIPITCALFVGAIVLDLFALIKILFSDWTIARLEHSKFLKIIHAVHKRMSNQARWSGRVSQHNFIKYSLKKRSQWFESMIDRFGIKSTYDEIKYKYSKHVSIGEDGLKEFIFNGLKEKAQKAQATRAAKEMCDSRGKGAITGHENLESVKNSVIDIEYDESVLLWHIATDLLYFTLKDAPDHDEEATTTAITYNNKLNRRQICKILSDYMLYLIVMRPTMMSAVVDISQIRFQDACAEAMRFFNSRKSISEPREACQELLLLVNTTVKPAEVKGDRSKSLLLDACILAKDLRTIDRDEMWMMMSGVWLELICYGASHCKGHGHAQQLSKGGELITFVWLLMTHFGLGGQFRIEAAPEPN
ncbi:hypothetical protein CASFOL_019137 [Castilleja foliolosa]|uniref:DUF4220 domain-containing protein n=1 Tax=Castilleja foliolosa TaxID=1961234 RepID=A0ABD3D3I4_9LAMI